MSFFEDISKQFILSNPRRARWVMTHFSELLWVKMAIKKALKTFHIAAQKVPAYKKFLKENHIDPEGIKTYREFKEKVPLTQRDNYFTKYKLDELCLGEINNSYNFSMTGGTSSSPIILLYERKNYKILPQSTAFLYDTYWQILDKEKKSLIINAYALGIWNAGFALNYSLQGLADKYNNITICTTGADTSKITELLKRVGKYYNQIIINAYPTFFRSLLDELESSGIDLKSLNIKVALTGEPMSEDWRRYVLKRLTDKEEDLVKIVHFYGSAEAGGSSVSTPISTMIKKIANQDKKLSKSLFNTVSSPTFVQHNPMSVFIEVVHNRLIMTKNAKIPLIKYDTKDVGGILSFNKVINILSSHGYNIFKLLQNEGYEKGTIFNWPFLYIIRRVDDTIFLVGANIYPENIETALHKSETKDILKYKLTTEIDDQQHTRFCILVELKKGVKLTVDELKKLESVYHDIFVKTLFEVNQDFRDAYFEDKKTTDPLIKIYLFGTGPFEEEKNNIKPKLVLKAPENK